MDHTNITQFAAYQGYRAPLQDKDTKEPLGTIFVYQEDSRKFARFVQFNGMLDAWFFSELPPAFADDDAILTNLVTQLEMDNITFLLHPNEIPQSATSTTTAHHLQ